MKHLTLIDKAFLLKRSPLFSSLDLNLLLAIADKLGAIAFKKGHDIFVMREEAHRLYFILQGKITILSADNHSICTLEQGEFFGEESLFNHQPRGYTARAETDVQLLFLSRTNLYSIIQECPAVALGFLQVYTQAMNFRPMKFKESNDR